MTRRGPPQPLPGRAWRAGRAQLGRLPRAVRWALAVVAVAGLASAGYAGYTALDQAGQKDCPGHWHSTFLVFMDGHQVHFDRTIFYTTPDGIHDYHMHADDQIMHYHPPLRDRCTPLRDFMDRLGIHVGSDSIEFNQNFGGNEGTYRTNDTVSLEVHYAKYGQPWAKVDWSDVASKQMRPGDKLLVTYGHLTPDLVEEQESKVRDLGANYLGFQPPPEHDDPETNTTAPSH